MTKQYAYERRYNGETYWFRTDIAVSQTCTDENEKSDYGPSTRIVFWESDTDG